MKAATHPNQADRLNALYRYEILDTAREGDFDDIVELAASLCGAKISVINLIDAERQWFKAETGLGVRETPLDTSICSHVILQDDFVEIPDTLADHRTQDNPLCLDDQGLRYYAGALLRSRDGYPIGTLCVLHDAPYALNAFQKKSLQTLARQVMRELDLRLALREQEVLRAEMDHRVKNSLQSVSSIIRLYQARAGAESEEAFSAVARRVDAISLLHQELHDAADLATVPLQRYLTRLVALLQASGPENIKIDVDIDQIDTGSAQATSLGMVISEFIANSIKHGFPSGREGRVLISMKRLSDGSVSLTCSDNGVGSAGRARKPSAAEGLGARLVTAAASLIGAKVVRQIDGNGYVLSLNFTPD
jgi:two-component sensor histidine kinase